MAYKARLTLENNFKIRIHSNHDDYLMDLKDEFAIHVKNYYFMGKFKAGMWDGKSHFISERGLMPYGLFPLFLKTSKKMFPDVPIEMDDGVRNLFKGHDIEPMYDLLYQPRPYQKDCIETCLKYSKGIVESATACHAKGDKIILHTGDVKNIEDIKIGDYVIGKDGNPKKVINTFNGIDDLYTIEPKNKRTPITVTKNHLLHLGFTNRGGYDNRKGTFENISVEEYLNKTKWYKHISKLSYLENEIKFKYKKTDCKLSPYFIGLYLGDGGKHVCNVTTADKEIINEIYNEANKFNMEVIKKPYHEYQYMIKGSKNKRNIIFNELEKLGIIFGRKNMCACGDRFIPKIIFNQNIEYRKDVLAGLIDSDGSLTNQTYYEFSSKSKKLRDDTELLSISIGLPCSKTEKVINGIKYYRLYIMGNINKIPVKIERKKLTRKSKTNAYRSGFNVKYMGKGNFYGIQVEDSLYITENGMITHNSGKSLVISYIIKNLMLYREKTNVRKCLIIVPSIGLTKQFKSDMIEYGLPKSLIGIVHSKSKQWDKHIVISTWQSLKSNHDKLPLFNCVMVDECLYPDTEILTNKGWKLIKNLKNEKVAQWNNSENISFVYPIKYIEKDFDGNMIHLEGKHTDILATPNHQQPYKTIYKNKKEFNRKKEIDNMKLHYTVKIPVAGNNNGNGELTPLMRFKIMTQADGYITPKGKTKDYRIVQFQFSKERKIKRFFSIMEAVKFKWKEIKTDYRNNNKKRRFQVQAPLNISKSLWDIIDLEKINSNFVDEFIDELTRWDGSRKNVLYYSTSSSKNADFIQAICSIGGWKCSRTIQYDDRKETYKHIHRLYFFKKSIRETQQLKKEKIPYKGKVYCVRVPDGNIIIRRNNKVMITGNCHKTKATELKKILSKCKCKYRYGFTGTNPPHKVDFYNVQSFIGPVLRSYSSGFLADKGYISKCNVKRINISYPDSLQSTDYKDIKDECFHKKTRLGLINDIVKNCDDNVLLLVSYISEGDTLRKMLDRRTDKEVIFLSGKDDVDYREEIRQRILKNKNIAVIATYGIFECGINIPNLKYLILASPTKSKVRTLQSIGRVLRLHESKKDGAFVYDIIDVVKYLHKHSEKRLGYYESEGFDVEDIDFNPFISIEEMLV